MNFPVYRKRFKDYVSTFAAPDGSWSLPVAKKSEHTDDVCRIAQEILNAEKTIFPTQKDHFTGLLAALFHDVSRFEQYTKFGTFRDDISYDHGQRSGELLIELKFLPELPGSDVEALAKIILVHNRLTIPPDFDPELLAQARLLRDADKLAILDLILDFFARPADYLSDRTMKLDLPDTPGFLESIADKILSGKNIPHKEMHNINDFKLTLFSWCNDYNYPAAAAYALEQRHYERLRKFLPPSEKLDRLLLYTLEKLNLLKQSSRG